MAWKLVARRAEVLYLGTHLYYEILDDNNQRVWHIHGLATDEYGQTLPVGNLTAWLAPLGTITPTDTIKSYFFAKDGSFEANEGSQQLYSGTQTSIDAALKNVYAAQNFINAQNFIYWLTPGNTIDGGFGGDKYNSNSMFNTLMNVFKKTLPINAADIITAKNLGGSVSTAPGKDLDILLDMGWSRNTLDASGLGSVVQGTSLPDSIYAPATGLNKLSGGAGNDGLFGNTANDELRGDAGNDTLTGGDGNDSLYGGNDDDAITGDAGNDMIYGDAGNDSLAGGAGNDQILGGLGNDTIIGGAGADTLNGSDGVDIFIYNATAESTRTARDTITGFTRGTDKIILTGLGLTGMDTDGGTTEAGELRLSNGSLISDQIDFAINLSGITPLAGDIVF
jgi:Ca2+-binding RTX toxin-like protein